jgi:manganese efflux pump family protein
MIYTVLLAIGLSMDAFGVSVALGGIYKKKVLHNALRSSLVFGVFHTVMPFIGWVIGLTFRSAASNIGPWIAFAILTFIGIKMIYESARKRRRRSWIKKNTGMKSLLVLGLATSIDAMIAGIGLSFLGTTLFQTAIILGVAAFCLSLIGVLTGNLFKDIFKNKAGILGGALLIIIGFKTILIHLCS